ncbi:MAG: hypothetical protein HOF34_13965 [Rhodospirillaceae bacterium]|nr:hypothetical protein [Rhodospirillaceae bacterium]
MAGWDDRLPRRHVVFTRRDEQAYLDVLRARFPSVRVYLNPDSDEAKGPEPPEVPLLTTVPERFSTFLDFAFSPGWKPTWTWNESSRSGSMGPLSYPNGSMLRGRARGKSRRRPDLGPGFDPPTFDVGEIYFRCRKDVPEDMKVARAALRLIGKVASNQNQIVVHYPTLENRGPVEKGSWWWIGNDARQWLLDQPDRMTAYSVMSMRGIRPATSD